MALRLIIDQQEIAIDAIDGEMGLSARTPGAAAVTLAASEDENGGETYRYFIPLLCAGRIAAEFLRNQRFEAWKLSLLFNVVGRQAANTCGSPVLSLPALKDARSPSLPVNRNLPWAESMRSNAKMKSLRPSRTSWLCRTQRSLS
jgi:hypothetical protein